MTIKSITPIALNLPFEVGGPKPLFAGKLRNMEILLVRVETDSGIVGWGAIPIPQCWSVTGLHEIADFPVPVLIGIYRFAGGHRGHDCARCGALCGRAGSDQRARPS